jgi:hypothetical protein
MSIILENEKIGKRFTVSTKAVTTALILARADKDPDGASETTVELHRLAGQDGEVNEKLVGRFSTRIDLPHAGCLYSGTPGPGDQIKRRIRETNLYINAVRKPPVVA